LDILAGEETMDNFSIFAIDSNPHPILDIKKISFFFVQEIGCPRYQYFRWR
jgi:hypothetical protein